MVTGERHPCDTHCWAAPGKTCYRCGRTGRVTVWWSLKQWLIQHEVFDGITIGLTAMGVALVVLLLWAGMLLAAAIVAGAGLLIATKHV